MKLELWVLVAAAILHWALVLTAGWGATWYRGVRWTVGNRTEAEPELPPWLGRAQKASHNLQENLAPFAIVVLVAVIADRQGDLTAVGAMLFLGARAAHAMCYLAGIPWARSACYVASMIGVGLVMSALFAG